MYHGPELSYKRWRDALSVVSANALVSQVEGAVVGIEHLATFGALVPTLLLGPAVTAHHNVIWTCAGKKSFLNK